MRWALIILTYDAEATIERCLHSIARVFDGEELEVLIHDNGSRDATVERLRRISESGVLPLRLYLSPRNQGTTVPRNRLARLSRGEFLIVLDADTELVQLPPVELAERLRAEPLTLIAPELRLGDGSVQDSVRPFPTVGDKLRRAWGIVARAAPLTADRYHLPRQDALDVDCAMAACWVLTRQLWERVGELDERIFYSPEDLDWCLRPLRQLPKAHLEMLRARIHARGRQTL